MRLFDAHCHVVEGDVGDCDENTVMIMMTSKSKEWHRLAKFDTRHVRAYGIHPWFSAEHNWDTEKEIIRSLLEKDPRSIVGEIGLDRIAKDRKTNERFSFAVQIEMFVNQMNLAVDLNRPVSIHAVKSDGFIVDYFSSCARFPPAIMLHSFSSSKETMIRLINIPIVGERFYFSFSTTINGHSPKTIEKIALTPRDNLLIESDVSDIKQVDSVLDDALNMVCKAKGWTSHEAKIIMANNILRFLITPGLRNA